MSTVNNASEQPPTSAKVILYTSHGELQIQLWTKQAPLACKNFIKHCYDGYYNNTIFHRMIPGFMIQGGDPSGTGTGGQSIYKGPFKDEFHQRLKFSRRGIVAMANAGKNSNGSQFFITFGECQHLNKKHTIFGKIVGDTIYNLMALQSLDTDNDDKPNDPPIIRKTKVSLNPFEDIQPKVFIQKPEKNEEDLQKKALQLQKLRKEKIQKKSQLKKLKKKNKLTFDMQEQQQTNQYKVKSSHDVLSDSKLSKKLAITEQDIQNKKKQRQKQEQKAQMLKQQLNEIKNKVENQEEKSVNYKQKIVNEMIKKRQEFDKGQNDVKIQDEVLNYQKKLNKQTGKMEIVWSKPNQRIQQEENQESREEQNLQTIEDQKMRKVRELQLKQYQMLKADQLNFKKAKQGSLKEKRKQRIGEQKKLLSNLQKHRYEFKQKQKIDKHEGELFKRLSQFNLKLKQSQKIQANQKWMNHKLKFHIDSDNAYNLQKKNVGKKNEDLQDGGLKIEWDSALQPKTDGMQLEQLYKMVHKEQQQQKQEQN